MSLDALSPRHRESPLTRRSRDLPPPTTNCLEVQWRFLQHKNPKPPQFGSPQRKPLLVNPIIPQAARSKASHASSKQPELNHPGSPSRLFHMFEVQDVEAEEVNFTATGQIIPQQDSNLPESPRASRTLNDLMGETQRQAMLDRILADMEYLAVEPTYSRLGQPDSEKGAKATSPRNAQRARSHKPSILQTALQDDLNSPKNRFQARQRKFSALWSISQGGYSDDMDDDDDDDDGFEDNSGQTGWDGHDKDRKRRQRRKFQHLNQEDQGPRIFWQKTTGAVSAANVPARLLTLSPSPPHRMQSSGNIVLGRRSYTSRQLLSPATMTEGRQRSKHNAAPSTDLPTQAACSANPSSPTPSPQRHHRHNLRLPTAPAPPAPISPPKAHYGAWYVPQSEWWTLHQIEQQNNSDKLPASATALTDADEPHCHGGGSAPAQRQHKPTLPPAALSSHGNENAQSRSSKPAVRGSHIAASSASRAPSASSAPSSAPGPLELQVAGIPQSYIGREYRAYIVSTGSAIPQYLQ